MKITCLSSYFNIRCKSVKNFSWLMDLAQHIHSGRDSGILNDGNCICSSLTIFWMLISAWRLVLVLNFFYYKWQLCAVRWSRRHWKSAMSTLQSMHNAPMEEQFQSFGNVASRLKNWMTAFINSTSVCFMIFPSVTCTSALCFEWWCPMSCLILSSVFCYWVCQTRINGNTINKMQQFLEKKLSTVP